ncbi:MAG: hypothetical protein E7620_03065 [Ruminococcaceae bacterium]|nr:hypothetical protein [Oscillospiraceae bacterium]
MLRKKRSDGTAQGRGRKRLSAVFTVVPLLIGVFIGGFGLFLEGRFERELPQELFALTAKSVPPSFYTFSFTDRANRQGEEQLLNVGGSGFQKGAYTRHSDLPPHLLQAFVAIEDKRFYGHRGVDWYRTLAAGVSYVFGFSDSFGASTITQQTVKNVTGNSQVTLSRKLQEILYARDLERLYTKDEILELYVNVIPFSDGCIGVGEASDHYFSKEPRELTVAEAATVAAITNNPSYYNPIRHPENNLKRRNLILREMRQQGYLTEEAYQEALGSPLALAPKEIPKEREIHSWYLDMVIEDVIGDLCREYGMSRAAASLRVLSGGLRIDVAMDPTVQAVVEEYYENGIRLPTGANGASAQSALIVIDNQTGDVLGVAGAVGKKTANRIQNYATQTLRSPGSSIKPITVYGPALEEGIINWASVYDDVPVNFTERAGQPWPRNANGVYRGLTNVSYAVAHSTNTVAVRILEELGRERAFRYAKDRFHLESLAEGGAVTDCDVAALALGQLNYGLTLRELTDAYTVFADRGCYHPYRSYYRVLDGDGTLLLSNPDVSERVLSEENAAIMTKLLQGVVENGTSGVITLGRRIECAGKTGTTQNDHDRWFIGYTPQWICGVWCGYEYPEPLVGRNLCTGIWNEVMTRLSAVSTGKKTFEVPSGVMKLTYCRDSGALLADACHFDPRGERMENGWFTRENCPNGVCGCHTLCHCDEVLGGISHGNCPNERRVSLIRALRQFPMEIFVTDAQYVWRGDPKELPPNPNEKQAYFQGEGMGYVGRSAVEKPFNRSCQCGDNDASQPPSATDQPETEAQSPTESEEHNFIPWRIE